MGVIVFAIISTIFGFAPTGLIALAHALGAWSSRRELPVVEALSHRQRALKWCWISVVIGVLVEVPVVVTLASHFWRVSTRAVMSLPR